VSLLFFATKLCCNYNFVIFKKVWNKPWNILPNESTIRNFDILIVITVAYSLTLVLKRRAKDAVIFMSVVSDRLI
jgi:hypothetical protein